MDDKRQYDLTYISLGAGVQSSALLAMSALGLYDVPKADVAIFADTQAEPKHVYEHLERLKVWSDAHGIPVHVVTAGNIWDGTRATDTTGDGRTFLPFFTVGDDGKSSILLRKCTSEYKILPITKHVREMLGYAKGQRVNGRVRCMMGISWEEIYRMKPSRTPWIENVFPLIDHRITRQKCLDIWRKHVDLPLPSRSSCVFCPYHNNDEWRHLRDNNPSDWDAACAFDESTRDLTKAGVKRPVFLHRSLVPLRDVDLEADLAQGDLFLNECEGMCGV